MSELKPQTADNTNLAEIIVSNNFTNVFKLLCAIHNHSLHELHDYGLPDLNVCVMKLDCHLDGKMLVVRDFINVIYGREIIN